MVDDEALVERSGEVVNDLFAIDYRAGWEHAFDMILRAVRGSKSSKERKKSGTPPAA